MARRGGPLRPWCGALLAGTLAIGCSRVSPGPTQAQYVAVADQVCEAHQAEIDTVVKEERSEPDPARTERWIRADLVPEYRKMADALRGIRPPEGDEAYLADLYGDLAHQIDLLHSRPSEGRALVQEDEDLRRRFSSYGMKVCGRV